jgi:ATP-dependent helicase/nuclease subunit A
VTLTEEQRRAVEAPGSTAVVAGAGTGKTHMLVARYLHHLSADGLSPLQVVAVTFTEKAAEELRSRIRRQARESLPDSETVLAELEAAQIGTIHALCARICREHPEEAGVPPDFGILDELRGALWTADRLADLLDEVPSEHYDTVPYLLMQVALESFFADPLAAEEALDKGPEGWEELARRTRTEVLQHFSRNPDLKTCVGILETYQGAAGDRAEDARVAALSALSGLDSSTEVEQVRMRFAVLDGIDLRGGSKKYWREGKLPRIKEALKTVRELARAEIKRGLILLEPGPADDQLAEMLPVLRSAFQQARDFISQAKRRSRLLDFSDLEVHALRALEDGDVRSYYRERWHAFLVDEFQDTNPVQAVLLERLTQGARLTVVGDEKQSIYGFRRADVEVFRRFRASILSEGGNEVVLPTSFRAHVGITTAINAVFSPVLGLGLRQDLSAHRVLPPHEGPHVRAYAIEAENNTRKALLRRAEATLISRLVEEMLEGAVLVHDRSTETERPCRPGDFALLSRAWEPLDLYGEALSAAGIPTVHAGGGDLLQTREAKDGLALLRFLVDPEEDDVALVALLRSPFFALDDRLFTEFADQREEGASWWRLIRDASNAHAQLAKAVEILNELLDARRLEPPAELLALADRLTGYTAVIANLPGADRREADWRGFRDLVRDLSRGSGDTFAVIRWLRRLLDADAQVPRPPLEAGNAVTLTTIHGSKGLEWPVVILHDLDRRLPSDHDQILFDPALGVSVHLESDEVKPVLHHLISDRKASLKEAELRRLLYVALTRTADHLILTTTEASTNRLCGLTLLRPGLELADITIVTVPFHPQDAQPPELPNPTLVSPLRLLTEPIR